MRLKSLAIVAVLATAIAPAWAQETASPDAIEQNALARINHQESQVDSWPHPQVPAEDGWARVVLWIVLLGFFLPAAVIGPLVRQRVASELPELHDREEHDALSASQHEPGHTRKG